MTKTKKASVEPKDQEPIEEMKVFEPARIERPILVPKKKVKDEAIRVLKNAMKNLDKNSPRYARLERKLALLK